MEILDDDLRLGSAATTFTIPVADWHEGPTIAKVNGLEMPVGLTGPAESLEGRVVRPEDAIAERLQELDEEQFEAMEDLFVENPNKNANYIVRLQVLVAALLSQLQQISEKDKDKISQLKKEYKQSTLSAAKIQRDLGWSNLQSAAFAFGASFLQFASPHQSDKEIANLFAKEVVPNVGKLLTSDLDARFTRANNFCQQTMADYNMHSGAEQGKANDKQQVSSVFERVLNLLKSSTQPN